jgi:uncharacterized membrane protein
MAAAWRSRLTAPSYHGCGDVPERRYAAAVVATEPPPRAARGGRGLAFDYDRTVALSDGVFAIALTLLVLTIPEIESADDLWGQLEDNLPAFGAYGLSFVVLSALWRQHHVFLREVTRIDARLTSLNLLYLGIVALIPYPTGLVAEHGDESASVVVYAAALAAVTLVSAAMAFHTQRAGLAPPRAIPLWWTLTRPAVFLLSIPIALVDPAAGIWFWLALIPVGVLEGRAAGRAVAPGGG